MKSNNYKVDIEIYIVFIVVIGISVFNALYSTLNITQNQKVNNKIMTVDIPSLQALEKMNLIVTRSEMYCTNWTYIVSSKDDKERLKKLQSVEYPELKNTISNLMKEWKDKENAESMNLIFDEFQQVLFSQKQVMEKLVTFDDYQDPMKKFSAEEIVEGQIIPQTGRIISRLNTVISNKKYQADLQHTTMRSSYRTLMWSVLGIAIMVVLVILMAAFYLSNNIIVPLMKLKNYILLMGKGEIPDVAITIKKNAVGLMTEAVRKLSESLKRTAGFAHNIGEGNFKMEFKPLGPNDELGNALVQMRESLSNVDHDNKQRHWVATGLSQLNDVLRENTDDIGKLSDEIINSLVKFLNVCNGAIYLLEYNGLDGQPVISLKGCYALTGNQNIKQQIKMGEGLIGQAMKDQSMIHLKNAPGDYLKIGSALGESQASHVLIVPLKHHGEIYGAIELASFSAFREHEIEYIESIGETMGSTIASSKANTLTKKLLDETRKQAVKLTAQEEELRTANEELSNQSSLLQASEEGLKQSNFELMEKAKLVADQNERLEQARGALSIKVKELELNSKYKSEFLANMSHELRTPLNSVLILAKLLADNKNKTLTPKEIEYSNVIFKSGNDLLVLINDVLDLSKIEAGKTELCIAKEEVVLIKDDMRSLFSELANQKKIDYSIEQHSNVPDFIMTDKLRLEQVIKNLLSNAFKFTEAGGSITFKIKLPERNTRFKNPNLLKSRHVIEFSVTDTGIGIPAEKQQLIFEAFQQEDSSTSRKYGGTGLGLSISRMLVSLLGGEMQLISEKDKGSTFFVFLPIDGSTGQTELIRTIDHNIDPEKNSSEINSHRDESLYSSVAEVDDDRNDLQENDKVILIVEDDPTFAGILVDFAHNKNYKAVVATRGDEGVQYAEQINPAAIILDMQLPVMDGWSVLKKIKENEKLKHVPVHIMSAMDRKQLGLEMGAIAYLRKPIDKRDLDDAFDNIERSITSGIKKIMIAEDEPVQFGIFKNLLRERSKQAMLYPAINREEATRLLNTENFDCIILNLDFDGGHQKGFGLLEKINKKIPVIVYTGTEITASEENRLKQFTDSIIIRNAEANNRILDEAAAFLAKTENSLAEDLKNRIPEKMQDLLHGKNILLVDDDMRNTYALTGVLEDQGMIVFSAVDGKSAIEMTEKRKHIDIVLMDIMMPGIDGYTAIHEIRKQGKYKTLPIIVQTSNAMKGEREKCLQAGASDFITKPINVEQLLSLMRVWLYKE